MPCLLGLLPWQECKGGEVQGVMQFGRACMDVVTGLLRGAGLCEGGREEGRAGGRGGRSVVGVREVRAGEQTSVAAQHLSPDTCCTTDTSHLPRPPVITVCICHAHSLPTPGTWCLPRAVPCYGVSLVSNECFPVRDMLLLLPRVCFMYTDCAFVQHQ